MIHLGILNHPSLQQTLSNHFDSSHFQLSTIKTEEELAQLDGLILPVTDKNALTDTISWLLKSMKQTSLFVWIYATTSLKQEEEILLEMGANEVVEGDNVETTLSLIIKNLYQRIGYQSGEGSPKELPFLNAHNQSVLVNGRERLLTRQEYTLFSLLYKKKNTCVTYEELMEQIWPGSSVKDIFRVANIVFHLRSKVEESADFAIETVRSRGYRLVGLD